MTVVTFLVKLVGLSRQLQNAHEVGSERILTKEHNFSTTEHYILMTTTFYFSPQTGNNVFIVKLTV